MKISELQVYLKKFFGYDQFKPSQLEVIQNILNKQDTLAIMPTGGGKSLCYQLPALIFPGLTVVVSPLIALMKDQVEQLHELNIPAVFLNSSLSSEEYQKYMDLIRNNETKLLYVAPETLLTPRIYDLLSEIDLDCFTIDEAHCISEWGHDFRPEYRQLAEFRSQFPNAVCLALTATATPRVRKDIKDSLHFKSSNEFIASFNRENLMIEVLPKDKPHKQTIQFLKKFPNQSGIIYCFSRRQVDQLSAFLAEQGFSVLPYHAGLSDEERKQNQKKFIRDDVQIIVATIAFGMGINKPNVRFVLHFDLPKSIENYYQEIGRAGRDGLPAHCLLLYSPGDAGKIKYFIEQKEEPERQAGYDHLNALMDYVNCPECRRIPLLKYFGEIYPTENCGLCDNCLNKKRKPVDITIPAQKFLSCVVRTGEIFGAAHIIHVLLGSKNQKVLKFEHQNLSTYGIGKELTQTQWMQIESQLLQQGYLIQDPSQFSSLKLTPLARRALKSKEPIMGLLDEKAGSDRETSVEYDQELFAILRTKRKEMADAAGIPPYVIFSDKTLAELATFYPATRDSLLHINGIGEVKAEKYGAVFLKIILEYCQNYGITEKEKPVLLKPSSRQSSFAGEKSILIGENYNSGQSIADLMEQYHIKQETVLSHLSNFVIQGHTLRKSNNFLTLSQLSQEQQEKALAAFQKIGSQYLKPLFDEFEGSISYDELKILRLHFIANSANREI